MTWLYCVVILVSSCLLFLVQPLCAKMLLPLLGGTPAVWNTCLVFFQAGLLLGYAYAHWLPRALGVRRHAFVHLALLLAACLALPIRLPSEIAAGWHPVAWLIVSLALAVGFPFFLLAAGAPLLQRWFACRHHLNLRDPYFLYAASNIGSFLGLGLFPFVLEPAFRLSEQSDIWRWAFVGMTALLAFCVPLGSFPRPRPLSQGERGDATPDWLERGRWIALALIPSSLLLSVTTHLTTNIAAIPLLWLIPMGLYLLTFTLAFAGRPLPPRAVLIRWLPMVVIVVLIVMLTEATEPLLLVLGIHLFGFTWLALLCHGELARTRPPVEHLTDFYLCLALGGVLGGAFSALVAPLIFRGLAEYPLMIVAACWFGMGQHNWPTRDDWLGAAGIGMLAALLIMIVQAHDWGPLTKVATVVMFGVPFLLCYITQGRPARFVLCLAAVLLASGLHHGIYGAAVYRERSYFGIHRVADKDGLRRLVNGNTVHGQQSLDPEYRREPLTYYSKIGPIGDVFRTLDGDTRRKLVGIVGLGAGTLAAYSQPGDDWTYFEIDPSVKHIAENPRLFSYLHDARGTIRIDIGDARLQLQHSTQKFGLLIVDAFGSDAIPLHLLTREAMQIYFDHLKPHGLLAFHISNRYVDLEPVLANLGAAMDPCLVGYVRRHGNVSEEEERLGIMKSDWAVFARSQRDMAPLLTDRRTLWSPAQARPGLGVWTDDHSNLWQVFRWSE